MADGILATTEMIVTRAQEAQEGKEFIPPEQLPNNLAIGAGAIFQVIYEIAKLIQKDTQREAMPMIVFSGVLTGMMMLWVTGLLIK